MCADRYELRPTIGGGNTNSYLVYIIRMPVAVTVYRLPIRLPAKSALTCADLAGSLIGSL